MRIDDYLRKLESVGASELLLSADRPPLYQTANELLPLPGEGSFAADDLQDALRDLMTEDEWSALHSEHSVAFVADLGQQRRVRGLCSAGRGGLSARFRLLRSVRESVADLQLPAAITQLADADSGLLIVTGPAGSGKSTLVATWLAQAAKRNVHIATVESPVEYLHERQQAIVVQRAIGRHCASQASAFEAALDSNADVIVCSALAAEGVFGLAVEAANTGTLVIGELPGHGSANALEYLLMRTPSSLRAHVCSDLSECLLAVISIDLLAKKGGGRLPAAEVLLSTPNVASLVRDGKINILPSLLDREPGMQSMDRSLLDLANRGLIEGRDAYAKAADKRAFTTWES